MTAEIYAVPEQPDEQELAESEPHDRYAEIAVLGALLQARKELEEVHHLVEPSDFYRPAHQLIYSAILTIAGRGETPDPILVADHLASAGDLKRCDGPAYLHQLTAAIVVTANASYYADIVRGHAERRRLIQAGKRIISLGHTPGSAGTGRLYAAALHALQEAAPRATHQPPASTVRAT